MSSIYNYFDTVKRKLLKCPLTIQLEISNSCVAKCVTCKYRDQKITSEKTSEDIIKIINDMAKKGLRAIRLTGGEPIIAPGFPEIVNCCIDNKLKTSITTTLLTEKISHISLLKNMNVKLSLSCVEDEYKNFFQIDNNWFKLVKRNLDILRNLKKRFSVNYTIFDKNYSVSSIEKFVNFINPYHPNYVTFFPALNYKEVPEKIQKEIVENFKKLSSIMKFKSNARTIEKHFIRRKERKNIVCHINKFHAHIKRNGDVYPCCMSGGEIGQELLDMFKMGNIFEEDIQTIYERNYDMFKGKNLANNPICKECTQRYLMINYDYEMFCKSKNFQEI